MTRMFRHLIGLILLPYVLVASDCCESVSYRIQCLREEQEAYVSRGQQARRDAQRIASHDQGEARYLYKKAEWHYTQARSIARQIRSLEDDLEAQDEELTDTL